MLSFVRALYPHKIALCSIGIGPLYMHRVSINEPIGFVLRTCIVSPYNVITQLIHYEMVQLCTDQSPMRLDKRVHN